MPPLVRSDTRAVCFDAVGTLLFPSPPAVTVYAEVARRAGLDLPPAEVRTRFLTAYRAEEAADRATGWVTSEMRERNRWYRIVTSTLREVPDPDACFRELFEHYARPAAWAVNPDAADVLATLRDRGFVVGMGSNYDSRLLSVLEGFPELAALRDRVVVSAAVGFRKPAAEFFREVVRSAGCEPEQVLFVGDDVGNDFEGATAAGLRAVLLDSGGRHRDVRPAIGGLRELLG